MFTVMIDGKSIQVPPGTTILRAAERAGVHIPTLCDHKELIPYGGCRLCLVEVDGIRSLQPSCTFPVSDQMVVRTDTEKIRESRKFVLTLIFSERNHFCPFCQVSGGDCELQNAAYGEGMDHWPLQPAWKPFDVDASHPHFVLDHNRCILCRRCVRACSDLVGVSNLGIEERGAHSSLVADLGIPLGESSCVSCGTCLQVCPTGALMDRRSAYQGHEADLTHNQSICFSCSLGCGTDVLTRDNRVVRIEGDWNAPVNQGILCKEGRFMPVEEARERLVSPLIREDGTLRPASWEEALEKAADHLRPLAGKNGSGVAAVISNRLSAETLYAFKDLFTGCFQSTMVTSLEEGLPTALTANLADEAGTSFEGSLEALKEADSWLILGEDLSLDSQVAGFLVRRKLAQGLNLVIVDPEPNGFDILANCTLKAVNASDLDVLQGLTAAVIKLGLAKTEVTAGETPTLGTISNKCGIPEASFLKAATLISTAELPGILYGKRFIARSSNETLRTLLKFARLVGVSTAEESRLVGLKGQANSLAASQYRLDKPFELNGHAAVYAAVGDDQIDESLLNRLKEAPFLIVQASYSSQLTEMADVVLPVATVLEQEGSYLNAEGRLQQANAALEIPEGVRTNECVLRLLAARLGMNIDNHWKEALYQRTSPVSLRSL